MKMEVKPIARSLSSKTRGILVILHLALVSVFGTRIAFILGRRGYENGFFYHLNFSKQDKSPLK
jgi:membrane protein DedA with SNARE-associated domain